MNRTEKTTAALWLKAVAGAAMEEFKKISDELAAEAEAEYRKNGTKTTWNIPDIATVASSVSHEAVTVSDPSKLLAWVRERHPTEVVEVPTIRAAWLGDLLERAIASGDVACDPETGEVIPGLGERTGGVFGGVSITGTPAAKRMLFEHAKVGLRKLALEAGPAVPVVLAEIGAPDA